MTFSELGLRPELLRAVRDQGYSEPTPIQAKAIPAILEARDVLAAAQTGTGKTAGFTLPLLQRLSADMTAPRAIRALVLVPTRELAAQVGESVADYGRHLGLRHAVIFGGVSMHAQRTVLGRGVDIVVATPGRLLDHASRGDIDLTQVQILVLDEADRMLDMGFLPDIRRVIALLPPERQNLLFSATFADEIRALADRLLRSPQRIEVARRNAAAGAVRQRVVHVDRDRKVEALIELVRSGGWAQVLVFTRTKHGANRLAHKLVRAGISAAAIHGNKSQSARTRALAAFKSGDVHILCATDIAARGLDIEQLPQVVNFELPSVAEDYVHRIGRTGRAGASGDAVSLVCGDERRLLRDIERLLGRTLTRTTIEGFAPGPASTLEPAPGGGRHSARRTAHAGSGERERPRPARRRRARARRSSRRRDA